MGVLPFQFLLLLMKFKVPPFVLQKHTLAEWLIITLVCEAYALTFDAAHKSSANPQNVAATGEKISTENTRYMELQYSSLVSRCHPNQMYRVCMGQDVK